MIGLILLLGLMILVVFWGVSQLVAVFFGAPTIASRKYVIQEALTLAQAKPGEKFIDLGCGYGKVLYEGQKLGLKSYGVDASPACVIWNRLLGRQAKIGDIRKTNLNKYNIIYLYLLPKLVTQIDFTSAKKSAHIIAVDFPIPHKKTVKTKKVGRHTIYLYKT